MLSVLVVAVLAQSECRFSARWMLPVSVGVRTPSGVPLGSLPRTMSLPAPMAGVVLTNEGATIALSHRGARLKVLAKSLPVSTTTPLAFGHGLQTVESSLLKVTRVDGEFVEVVPDVPGSFEWKPQRVACADLQLGRLLNQFSCESESPVEFSSTPDGPNDWKLHHTKLSVVSGAVEVTLIDGSIVRGWSKRSDNVSFRSTSCFECDVGTEREPQVCSRTVPLFSSSGEKVGELQAGASFIVRSKNDQWVELWTMSVFEHWKLAMKREDFERCGE